jgi:hypothetical protein
MCVLEVSNFDFQSVEEDKFLEENNENYYEYVLTILNLKKCGKDIIRFAN